MEVFLDPANLFSLFMLTVMEIVLGIDNIIFVSIVAGKLPKAHQRRASNLGMVMAMGIRIALLFGIKFIVEAEGDLFSLQFINDLTGIQIFSHPGMSAKDLILIAGGLFLLYKSVSEMHEKLQGEEEMVHKNTVTNSFTRVIIEIAALNIVFSFDSILTAIGLVDPSKISIMIVSIILSMIAMMFFSAPVSNFVNNRPTVKMLALSFLVLIGAMLVAEGFGQEIPKGYIYFAIAYAFAVELLNLRLRKKVEPIHLRERYREEEDTNKNNQ